MNENLEKIIMWYCKKYEFKSFNKNKVFICRKVYNKVKKRKGV